MAKARIDRHPAVLHQDLPTIYAYIARDNPAAADRVLDAVEKTLDMISEQPECGVLYRTRNRRLQSVRMFPVLGFSNYLIFYRAEAESVRILYLLHGARHLTRLFRQSPRA